VAGEKNEPWRARQIVRSRLAGVAHRPDDGCRWNALAKALVRQGDVAGGVAAARRSTELDASHADHWRTLATALHRAGCHEDAVGSLEEAARLEPGDANLLNDLGVALNEVDRWAEALAVLDEALSVDPEHARAHNNRGVALDRLDRLDEAIDAYRRAAKLEPELAAVHFNLGTALRAKGRTAKAVAELLEAVRLDPEDAVSWYALGVTRHNHLADYEGAIEAYRTAIRLDPNPALFHESLGRSLVGFGNAMIVQERFGEAVEAFRQAVRLRPDDLASLVGLGGSLVMEGRHEEALGPLGRARELDDGVWQVHVNLAIAQRRLGRYAEAIASYRRALKLAPVLGVLDNFAWLLATCPDESLREPAQAVRLARAAVSLDRESGRLRLILGVALYRAGRCDDAARELNRSRALASEDDATTCLFLAMAHARLGREDEAKGWCAKAVARMQDDKTEDEQLARFRTEAEALLGR
jgi:tetratricopeptide (TPR) repeat protein